jgi:hypothetical protein
LTQLIVPSRVWESRRQQGSFLYVLVVNTLEQTAVSDLLSFTYLPLIVFYAYFQRIRIVGSYKIVHSISLIYRDADKSLVRPTSPMYFV